MRLLFIVLLIASIIGVYGKTTLTGTGASFPYNAFETIFRVYSLNPTTSGSIEYTVAGSGTGISAMKDKTHNFAAVDSSTPKSKDYDSNPELQLMPSLIGGIGLLVNLPELNKPPVPPNTQLVLSGKVLSQIVLGNITRWNATEIQQLNAPIAPHLPDKPIGVTAYGLQSGITSVLMSYLSKADKEFDTLVGEAKSWPTQFGNPTTIDDFDVMLARIRTTEYTLTYGEYSEFADWDARYHVQLQNKAGQVVSPTPTSLQAAAIDAKFNPEWYASIVNSDHPDAWPISTFSFFLISADCHTTRDTLLFFRWYYQEVTASDLLDDLGFGSLPEYIREDVGTYLESVSCGETATMEIQSDDPHKQVEWQIMIGLTVTGFVFVCALQIWGGMHLGEANKATKHGYYQIWAAILVLNLVIIFWCFEPTDEICKLRIIFLPAGWVFALSVYAVRAQLLLEIRTATKKADLTRIRNARMRYHLIGALVALAFVISLIHVLAMNVYQRKVITDTNYRTGTRLCTSDYHDIFTAVEITIVFAVLLWLLYALNKVTAGDNSLKGVRTLLLCSANLVFVLAVCLAYFYGKGDLEDINFLSVVVMVTILGFYPLMMALSVSRIKKVRTQRSRAAASSAGSTVSMSRTRGPSRASTFRSGGGSTFMQRGPGGTRSSIGGTRIADPGRFKPESPQAAPLPSLDEADESKDEAKPSDISVEVRDTLISDGTRPSSPSQTDFGAPEALPTAILDDFAAEHQQESDTDSTSSTYSNSTY